MIAAVPHAEFGLTTAIGGLGVAWVRPTNIRGDAPISGLIYRYLGTSGRYVPCVAVAVVLAGISLQHHATRSVKTILYVVLKRLQLLIGVINRVVSK